jgi:pSer/pThr/pTyr-binding forkhead associated (FHA) protein
VVVADHRAVLEDLGSKNGTFVGDERLTGPRRLEHGDEIRLGRELVMFRFVAGAETTLTELDRLEA